MTRQGIRPTFRLVFGQSGEPGGFHRVFPFRRHWIAIAAVAVIGAVGATMTVAPAATEAANDQLETRSISNFSLQPAQGRVAVTVDLSVTNKGAKRDQQSVPVLIQKGASDLSVSGKRNTIDLVRKGDVLDTYEVTYPRLAKGRTRELRVSYDLPGAGPEAARLTPTLEPRFAGLTNTGRPRASRSSAEIRVGWNGSG